MTYCGFISCVVLLWFDVCWCYGVIRLGWSGILMQAEALTCLVLYRGGLSTVSLHGFTPRKELLVFIFRQDVM